MDWFLYEMDLRHKRVIRWFEKVIRKIIRSNKVWYLHIILGYGDVVIAWNFVTLRIFS